MKRVVMPVRWQCANAGAGIVEPALSPCWRHSREPSCRHSPVSQQVAIPS